MRTGMLGTGTLLCLGLLANGASAQAQSSIDDALLHSAGEFMVSNGETKAVSSHKTDHAYRVCVRPATHGVALKVMHDGATTIVYPGDCSDFEAKEIKVAPNGTLAKDVVLMGRYAPIDTDLDRHDLR